VAHNWKIEFGSWSWITMDDMEMVTGRMKEDEVKADANLKKEV
jgi:hypothetical protein